MTVGRINSSGVLEKAGDNNCSSSDLPSFSSIGDYSKQDNSLPDSSRTDGLYQSFDIKELVDEVQRPYAYGKDVQECGLYPIKKKPKKLKGMPEEEDSSPEGSSVFDCAMKLILKPTCFYYTGFQTCDSPICLYCVTKRMQEHVEFAELGMVGLQESGYHLYFPTFTLERCNDPVFQQEQITAGWSAVTRAVRYEYKTKPLKQLRKKKKQAFLYAFFEENLRVDDQWIKALEDDLLADLLAKGCNECEALFKVRDVVIRKCRSKYRAQLKEDYKSSPVRSIQLHSTHIAKGDMKDLEKAAKRASELSKVEKASFDIVEYLGYLDTTFKPNPAEGVYHPHIHAVFAIQGTKDLERFERVVIDAWCGATTGRPIAQLVKMVEDKQEEGNSLGKFSSYLTKFNGMANELANGLRKDGIAKDSLSLIGLMQYAVDMDSQWARETYHNFTKAWAGKQQYWPSNGWKRFYALGLAMSEGEDEDCDLEEDDESIEIDIPEWWHGSVAARKFKIGVTLQFQTFVLESYECLDQFRKILDFDGYDYEKMSLKRYSKNRLKRWLEDFYPEDLYDKWKLRREDQKTSKINQYLGE